MALTIGTQLGTHEIIGLLGKGGMGEVYRARDLKLKREVAIKILREELSRDADRVSRFQREAEVLASLNHPNIAAIYDFEETHGTRYLVLELVEGETLADRIARGPVPLDEALRIAKQICDALQAAHDRGIIHRDLKPANIKLAPGGKVKVLDFGLAKALTDPSGNTTLSNSPTLVSGGMGGVIIGTAAYMSPEQARGMEVDPRTDIWAFGCVLYEILTSKPAFTGATATDIIAKIIERQPNWSLLPPETPLLMRTLLSSALAKDRSERLQNVADAGVFLKPNAMPTSSDAPAHGRRGGRFIIAALATALIAALIPATLYFLRAPEVEQPARFDLLLPVGVTLSGQFKLSPDGRKLAFVATSQSKQQIWIRPVDSFTAEPLPSTEGDLGIGSIFWSADSQNIAYFTEGQLKRVAATGGPSQLICRLKQPNIYFGTWNANGVILVGALPFGGPLLRVSASGGEPVPVGELDTARKEVALLFPEFLPDGRHYFYLGAATGAYTAYIGTLDSKDRYTLPGIASPAQVSSSGQIFFVRDGGLMAQSLDLKRFQLSREAFPITDARAQVTALSSVPLFARDWSTALFTSVSTSGSLAYVRGKPTANAQTTEMMWYDRKGIPQGPAGPPGEYRNPAVTPDGRLIAFERGTPFSIYVLNTQTGVTTHVTTDMAANTMPVWAPDERTILFTSLRDGIAGLYTRVFDAVGEDKLLLKATTVSADGWSKNNYVTYESSLPHRHIWVYSLTDSKPTQETDSDSEERGGRLSPDGRLLAYTAQEQGGQLHLFIQSFPGGVKKTQVSTEGGSVVRWRDDGKELYYLAPDASLMAVSITSTANSIDASVPRLLFKAPIAMPAPTRDYDVTADGRFLINVTNPAALNPVAAPISIVLNWTATLHKK